jgi:hypothetical protein
VLKEEKRTLTLFRAAEASPEAALTASISKVHKPKQRPRNAGQLIGYQILHNQST